MSVSNDRLVEYAKQVLNEELVEAVMERVHSKMLARFRAASPQEREAINGIMDADLAFLSELKVIIAQATEVENN